MYIYNVTITIDPELENEWLQWMQDHHIPAMLATGKFSKALMTRVHSERSSEGVSYSVQYRTDSKETLQKYYAEDAAILRAQSKPFEGRFIAFRTELEVIFEQ